MNNLPQSARLLAMLWIGFVIVALTCLQLPKQKPAGDQLETPRRASVSSLVSERVPGVKIIKLAFNPDGKDTGQDRSLNQEVIVLKNITGRAIVMDGWRVADRGPDNVFVFESYRLEPGTKVRIHSGSGLDTHRDLYWGLNHHVWNNGGDAVKLRRSNGRLLDRCAYEEGVKSPLVCYG